MKSGRILSALAVLSFGSSAFSQTMSAPAPVLNLKPGWNLAASGSNKAIDVPGVFGTKAATVATVWRWNTTSGVWDFYTPSTTVNSAQYAASKGYGALASIPIGEGFWINVSSATAIQLSIPYDAGAATIPGSIVGAWYLDGSKVAGQKLPIALTFLSDGAYLMADNGNTSAADPTGQPGIEVGTYTYNATTGAFSSACPTINTDGQWGLSHGKQGGATGCTGTGGTMTLQGSTLTLVAGNGDTTSFTRVGP